MTSRYARADEAFFLPHGHPVDGRFRWRGGTRAELRGHLLR
jgi:hypothetical protein